MIQHTQQMLDFFLDYNSPRKLIWVAIENKISSVFYLKITRDKNTLK